MGGIQHVRARGIGQQPGQLLFLGQIYLWWDTTQVAAQVGEFGTVELIEGFTQQVDGRTIKRRV